MGIKRKYLYWITTYILVLGGFCIISVIGSNAVTAMNQDALFDNRKCVVIDPGHGGVDGGTTSCTGVTESNLNLEVSLRLNDLLHLMGVDTKMIRTTDCSVYTEGNTIAAKKVSDLKERVRVIESTDNAILVSIHQNYFTQSQYSGAQVFCGKHNDSQILAGILQTNLIAHANPGSKRNVKKATGIYLMEHVTCPAVLVECGFLSNPKEEALLRDGTYQKKLCCIIANSLVEFINSSSSIT